MLFSADKRSAIRLPKLPYPPRTNTLDIAATKYFSFSSHCLALFSIRLIFS